MKKGTPVTWSSLDECKETSPKSELDPANTVPSDNENADEKHAGPLKQSQKIEEATNVMWSKRKSSRAVILSFVLTTLLVGGFVGFRLMKRSQIEEPHQFDAGAVWPPPLESNTARNVARTWQYPADHSLSNDYPCHPKTWEYSNEHGDLHNVVI